MSYCVLSGDAQNRVGLELSDVCVHAKVREPDQLVLCALDVGPEVVASAVICVAESVGM
jgi:hypothetical protein